ncbi:aminopeptidase P family protein [Gordonia shandongensis]|uniref:aminopeptidase P family protein n=1 Tax=Gordonia shandongensis TaxID=376351 RepID=UPI0005577065|nr:aminopeptidase P family protein [Gordonia shandongensis]
MTDQSPRGGVHERRRGALAASAEGRPETSDVDAFLVTSQVNVRYLTGFTGSNGALIVGAGDRPRSGDRIGTDGRYTGQVAAQAGDLEAVIDRATASALIAHATANGLRRIAVEGDDLTVSAFGRLRDAAESAGAELVPLDGCVARLRITKDADEVAAIAAACRIGDEALGALIDRGAIAPGRTERAVARDLEWEMFGLGADAIAFETIVAAGAHSAIPHHRPTDAVLTVGDLVKIDFGAVVDGYHSDMTRTVVLGEPSAWQREIHAVVERAQQAGRDALAVGADLRTIDAAARTVIADAGYGEYYVHGLGHGVGLEIHEAPGIGAAASGTLPDGATVTVEPGVYLPGRGGVRIEDTLVVAESGPRLLTTTPRTLRVL